MIRLAFSTLGCPSWPLARILDAAGRLGYDGVELRFVEGDDALWARPELTGAVGPPEQLQQPGRDHAVDIDAENVAGHALIVECLDQRAIKVVEDVALVAL